MSGSDEAPTEIWIASKNEKKAAELRLLLPEAFLIRTLGSFAPAEDFEVVEDAPDFLGNAEKKATEVASLLRRHGIHESAIVLADDSGLCVDALDGRPGVHSARYAGTGATDRDRIGKLLGELDGVPTARRTARFVCALVAVSVAGLPFFSTEEVCEGRILGAPSGTKGFGYDPVFAPDETPPGREGLAFASLTASEKDAVSHRGKAVRKLIARLRPTLS